MSRAARLAFVFSVAAMPSAGQFSASYVSVGPHQTCAIVPGGGLKCWGDNAYAALGDGTLINRHPPVQVLGLESGVRDVSTGHSITCAVLSAGSVRCWGKQILAEANSFNAHQGERPVPTPVQGLESGIAGISLDTKNACVVTTGGGVKCWGFNYSGQLLDGTTTDRAVPTGAFVPGLESGVRQVVTLGSSTCVLMQAGSVKCWGNNERGRLGDGTQQSRATLVDVVGLGSGVAALAQADPRCALMQDGEVRCWGPNQFGQLGDGTTTDRFTPTRVLLRGRATLVAATYEMACAALESGGLQCWGSGTNGRLGRGNRESSPTPVDVSGISGRVTSLSLSSYRVCAHVEVEGLKCWGDASVAAIGDGTGLDRLAPASVWSKSFPPSYQGLWWASPAGSESGWGVSIAQQGDKAFIAWFTYGADMKPAWFVVPDSTGANSFSGNLYSVTGPAFSSAQWDVNAVQATQVGTLGLFFDDADNGRLGFCPRNGSCFSKAITRQLFSPVQPECLVGAARGIPWNFTDLWWGAPAGSQSGWGLNLTHQGDTIFGVWYTYDASGKGQWIVMPSGRASGTNTFAGALYRTAGPAFDASPWQPSLVTAAEVGSATISFADADNGIFRYTLDGVSQSKPITRQVFSARATACSQ